MPATHGSLWVHLNHHKLKVFYQTRGNNDQNNSSCCFRVGARFRCASNAGFADASAGERSYASAYGLWHGQGNGQRCLPVQSRHAPGAPSHAQVRTILRRRLRSVALTAAANTPAAWRSSAHCTACRAPGCVNRRSHAKLTGGRNRAPLKWNPIHATKVKTGAAPARFYLVKITKAVAS